MLAVRVSSRDETSIAGTPDLEVAQPSMSPSPSVTRTVKPTPAGLSGCSPTGLSIPEIKVATSVLALGTDSQGRQSVPGNPTEASWWNGGVLPGQLGNAVFAGHTWSKGDGVFDRLAELKQDDIVVVHGKGCDVTFVVDIVQRHVPVNLPATQVAALYRTGGPSGIVLITCGDYSSGAYHSRIVVHALLNG